MLLMHAYRLLLRKFCFFIKFFKKMNKTVALIEGVNFEVVSTAFLFYPFFRIARAEKENITVRLADLDCRSIRLCSTKSVILSAWQRVDLAGSTSVTAFCCHSNSFNQISNFNCCRCQSRLLYDQYDQRSAFFAPFSSWDITWRF